MNDSLSFTRRNLVYSQPSTHEHYNKEEKKQYSNKSSAISFAVDTFNTVPRKSLSASDNKLLKPDEQIETLKPRIKKDIGFIPSSLNIGNIESRELFSTRLKKLVCDLSYQNHEKYMTLKTKIHTKIEANPNRSPEEILNEFKDDISKLRASHIKCMHDIKNACKALQINAKDLLSKNDPEVRKKIKEKIKTDEDIIKEQEHKIRERIKFPISKGEEKRLNKHLEELKSNLSNYKFKIEKSYLIIQSILELMPIHDNLNPKELEKYCVECKEIIQLNKDVNIQVEDLKSKYSDENKEYNIKDILPKDLISLEKKVLKKTSIQLKDDATHTIRSKYHILDEIFNPPITTMPISIKSDLNSFLEHNPLYIKNKSILEKSEAVLQKKLEKEEE
jgi:hypothetical protein